MGTPENKMSEFVDIVRSWIPRRGEPANVSRDFWMPDQSCRVCYECDSPFTVFNRKHHCRLCGRVFCAKCTANSVPAPSNEPRTRYEDWERIRVCNFCFKQWEQGIAAADSGNNGGSPGLSPSPSATSLFSNQSGCTCNSGSSTVGSMIPYLTGPYQCVQHGPGVCPRRAPLEEAVIDQNKTRSGRTDDSFADAFCSSQNIGYHMNRSDDEDEDYGVCGSVSDARNFSHTYCCYGPLTADEYAHMYGPQVLQDVDYTDARNLSYSPLPESFNILDLDSSKIVKEEANEHGSHDSDVPSHDLGGANIDPVDFENSGLLWLPPEPEDAEDLFDDEDEECDEGSGEWGYLRPSNSFGSGEYRSRDKSSEERKKAMKNVVEGHFRALLSQLLLVENISIGDEDDEESWLDIVTSLCWEAATLLKPDTSNSGGMDPGGYVKVKCLACGHRSESLVVKGVVCKKNVAHRRMMSKIDKPRFLILGGALEYQRVSNHLSSVDTLLQQEMDHLKMAVAKIDSHHPNVLLVEKSVSRYAQEYLLAKDISLVLNIKRPLLERIARCTGAHIVPSIDHLSSQKLGYCDNFHVERYSEEHGSAGQGGKKLTKTLMYFEGCPKPFGCTILLKGANGDELKKVKHVVQYGVFAAYHLALETSFLADEGASLPELPLKSPINVALPHKPSSIDRSISTIPGFAVPASGKPPVSQAIDCAPESNYGNCELHKFGKGIISNGASSADPAPLSNLMATSICLAEDLTSQIDYMNFTVNSNEPTRLMTSSSSGKWVPGPCQNSNYSNRTEDKVNLKSFQDKQANFEKAGYGEHSASACFGTSVTWGCRSHPIMDVGHNLARDLSYLRQDVDHRNEEVAPLKEEFPPSPSDHQSILVSLTTRCVWKGTVCERAHLLRIKYYGNFDKPLGRFLRDHLFDQNYHCSSCEMPSEAHVHCYTHRQGSLKISVKKLPEFLLPGEREGKIWMWHRCLRCPRVNGFPPSTRRVVMSDAAWGLSFGKFLELSFSNHAAASRAASCGHSLHRDCLRFYGFGSMVACFCYASIDVHSVYLPPPKVEFNYDKQDWIQKEANEVGHSVELLYKEVQDALHRITEKVCGTELQDHDIKAPESVRLHIEELKWIIQKEKEEFEESLRKATSKELKVGQPVMDILEINKLRRQILFHSYVWDQRLIHASTLSKTPIEEGQKSLVAKAKEKGISSVEKLEEMDMASKAGKGFSSCDSFLLDAMGGIDLNMRENGLYDQPCGVYETRDNTDLDHNMKNETEGLLSYSSCICGQIDPLEYGNVVRRVRSEGEFPLSKNISDTLDAAWIGKNNPVPKETRCSGTNSTLVNAAVANGDLRNFVVDKESVHSPSSTATTRVSQVVEKVKSGLGMPFPYFHGAFYMTSSTSTQKLDINEYSPVYISLVRELERQSGARLLLPVGIKDTVIPVYDDEPTSVIAYALVSTDYRVQMSEMGKPGDSAATFPLLESSNLLSFNSFGDSASDTYKSLGSMDESILSLSGSRGSQILDPLSYANGLHPRISFTDDGSLGKVKYAVTCYYAKRFEALRRTCCPSELDFIRSLSRCKKWGAQGGKSNVFFAKTLDDRFIIKQVTKTELESFIKFGPAYFKYLSESINTGSPTCLAKILGIYQVLSKNIKGGKELKMDVLVMENLLFRRSIIRLYDLKGSLRSRYNPDTSGSNTVLLDQNLIEAMPTSPIFVGNKAKLLLERAVWNDTSFLASIDVMDYSLLVGMDGEKHELVLGIIDFMRQYTWDKHLETWVKTAGILGGSKNTTPTVISPQQYKKRFRKAMTTYFRMVPDQWSPSTIIRSGSQSDIGEESLQHGVSVD